MGTSPSAARNAPARLTESEWSARLDTWTGDAEDTAVEPELIFRFDGKTVPGPAGSDPLRCRKTGRFLQHRSFTSLAEAGGLLALPLADKQGAHVRTGELAWLDKNRFAVALDFYLAPRTSTSGKGLAGHSISGKGKGKDGIGRKRVILVGGTAYPWLSLDAVPVSLNASRRLLEEASRLVGPDGCRPLPSCAPVDRCVPPGAGERCLPSPFLSPMNHRSMPYEPAPPPPPPGCLGLAAAEPGAASVASAAACAPVAGLPGADAGVVDEEDETLRISFNHIGVHFSCYTAATPASSSSSSTNGSGKGADPTAPGDDGAGKGKKGSKGHPRGGELLVLRPSVWHRLVLAVDYVSDGPGDSPGGDGDGRGEGPFRHVRYVVRAALDGRLLEVSEHCRFPASLRPAALPGTDGGGGGGGGGGAADAGDHDPLGGAAGVSFVSREKSFGFLDPLTRSCFQGAVRGLCVYSSPGRLRPFLAPRAPPNSSPRRLPRLPSFRTPRPPTDTASATDATGEGAGGEGAGRGVRRRRTRMQRLLQRMSVYYAQHAAAPVDADNNGDRADGDGGNGGRGGVGEKVAAEQCLPPPPEDACLPCGALAAPAALFGPRGSDHHPRNRSLGALPTEDAVFAVLHALPLNQTLLTGHCGHRGQYKGGLVNKWTCCDSPDPNSVGCGEYHPGMYIRDDDDYGDITVEQIRAQGVGGVGLGLGAASPPALSSGAASARLGGGVESDDSDGGSERSDRSSGREEKGSQGSGGSGHGPAPTSSRAASRARRRGHGHGKRPSAWDVIPSLANDGQKFTYSCCGRVSGGCERGVVTHHPGRYLRIETYNYTIKQYWECCNKKKRNGPGCQAGPHPDPFALRRKPFFAAPANTTNTTTTTAATHTAHAGMGGAGGRGSFGAGLDEAEFCQVLSAASLSLPATITPVDISEPPVPLLGVTFPTLPSSSDLSMMSTPPRKLSDGAPALPLPLPLPLPVAALAAAGLLLPQPPSPNTGRAGGAGGKKKVVFDYDMDVLGR